MCVCFWQEYVNDHPQWVKAITAQGVVHHLPWTRVYNDMKHSAGIVDEGYVCPNVLCVWHVVIMYTGTSFMRVPVGVPFTGSGTSFQEEPAKKATMTLMMNIGPQTS